MWKLEKPDLVASKADLVEVENHSYKFKQEHIKPVSNLYDIYDSQGGTITKDQHNTVAEVARDGLRLAYDKTSLNGIFHRIRDELTVNVAKCPMCSIGNASTLDHYMEKKDYQALSIMRQNLVPMCYDCNTIRNTNGLKPEDFIHAYYTALPDNEQWLKVKLTFAGGALKAEFYPDSAILADSDSYRKAVHTISGLNLNDTISKEIPAFLKSLLSGLSHSEIILKTVIKDRANNLAKNSEFGINHWKTALLNALTAKTDLTIADLKSYL